MNKNREIKLIFISFFVIIILGGFILMLPIAHKGDLTPIDAFFTATSAVCVTGLIVKDTSADFTFFGQSVILLLIQIGGIGYMTAVTFLAVMRNQKLAHRDNLMLKESLNYTGIKGLVEFSKIVFASIIFIEFVGMVVLTIRFWQDMPFGKAVWFGLFHSISAFNNAGFSLFGDNLMRYREDLTINITIPSLIILGGIGYMVIVELYQYKKRLIVRLSTNTKVVLWMYILLTLLGMMLMLSLEWDHAFRSMSWDGKILASWFASVNFRTAGFNTIDLSTLTESNLFFSTFFMMIGGGTGGTAGGLKVATVALAVIGMWYTLRGDTSAHIFKRSLPAYQINKAYAIIFVASVYVVLSTVILSEVENEKLSFIRILFETCSAFGTVGVSTGDGGVLSYSALFSQAGKINIILLMFMGRIGVFAFTILIIGKAKESRIKYAEGRIIL